MTDHITPIDWENRTLTWRYDWAWLIAYVAVTIGFLTWTVLWRHVVVFEELLLLVVAIAAVNLVRGRLIERAEQNSALAQTDANQ